MENLSQLSEQQYFFRQVLGEELPSLRSLTEDQKALFHQLTFQSGFVPPEATQIVQHYLVQSYQLVQALIPLYQIGFRFDVAITGGAIRDLLLGKYHSVKDLDILLSIDKSHVAQVLKRTPRLNVLSFLGQDIDNFIDWNQDTPFKQFFSMAHYLTKKQYCIEKNVHIDDFSKKDQEYGKMIAHSRLEGVIKIQSDDNNYYPIDLLVTDMPIKEYIDNTFDFNICKTYVNILQKENTKNRPYNVFSFMDNLYINPYFLEDVKNKTITLFMPKQRSLDSIEYSVMEHLPRIQKKYSNFSLNLVDCDKAPYSDWKKAYEQKQHLQNTLPQKDDEIQPRLKI